MAHISQAASPSCTANTPASQAESVGQLRQRLEVAQGAAQPVEGAQGAAQPVEAAQGIEQGEGAVLMQAAQTLDDLAAQADTLAAQADTLAARWQPSLSELRQRSTARHHFEAQAGSELDFYWRFRDTGCAWYFGQLLERQGGERQATCNP